MDPRAASRSGAVLGVAAAALVGWRLLARRRWWPGFEGRTVVIMGGTRGLGLLLARRFLDGGARVAICGRDPDTLGRALSDLRARGEVFGEVCDVRCPDMITGFLEAVRVRFGGIDVLVNNAGVITVGPVGTMTLDDFREAMDVHYWAPLHAILDVVDEMRMRGDGRIVNISSIGGKIAVPHLVPYDASKSALVGLSEGLRAELAKDGVLVTTVCPWLMRTGSPRNAWFKGRHEEEYRWFVLSDSLPLLSMSAERAADRIVAACRRGDAGLVLSLKGRLAEVLHATLPGTTATLLSLADGLLPRPGGIGREHRSGAASEGKLTRSFLTALTRRAEAANNEL